MIYGKRMVVVMHAFIAGKTPEKTAQQHNGATIPATCASHTSGGQRT